MIDVAEAARVCHARGVEVVIDSTFATPVNHRALGDGADLVIHSATKYLGGHNDLLAGAAVGQRSDHRRRCARRVGVLGGVIDAHAAWLLLRGLKTLGAAHGAPQRERPARRALARGASEGAARLVPGPREPSRSRGRGAHHAAASAAS